MGIFTVNHSKLQIDTTVDGIEGPARPPWPKGDKGDTGSKRDKGDRGLNTDAQVAKDDVGAQGLSGSGDSVDLSTVLLLDGTQIMTGNLHMNSKRVVILGNPSGAMDASNKKYVGTIANNILSGSETFQGDINMNNNRIKNLDTSLSNNDAVNRVLYLALYLLVVWY